MATYLDYPHMKAYYDASVGSMGSISFDVPENALEIPWKYNKEKNYVINGAGTPLHTAYTYDIVNHLEKPNSARKQSGYFYFIKIGNLYIADRAIILYPTWDELYSAGFVNGEFKMLSYSEYQETISTIPDGELWNNMPSLSNYGSYIGGYGEWTKDVRTSDNKVACICNLKAETKTVDIMVQGDYYYTQTAYKYNNKNVRNFLTSGTQGAFMPSIYRPAFDAATTLIYNNFRVR